MKILEINRGHQNYEIPQELEGFRTKGKGGLYFSYDLFGLSSDYQVYSTRIGAEFFIFKNGQEIAHLNASGHILHFKGVALDELHKNVNEIHYPDYVKGSLVLKGYGYMKILLNGKEVGFIGSKGFLSWIFMSIKSWKFGPFDFWSGVKYDDTMIDTDIVLTLLFSRFGYRGC